MKVFRAILVVALVTVGVVAAVAVTWSAIGGGPLPLQGLIALSLGVGGTVALAWVLMALAFRSDRDGWDDSRADPPSPPGTDHPA